MAMLFGMGNTQLDAGSGTLGQDLRPRNYREKAFELWPDSPTKLTYMLSKLPSRMTNDPEYKIFEWRLPQMAWTTVSAADSGGNTWTPTLTAGEAYGLKNGDIVEIEGTAYQFVVTTETTNGATCVLTEYAGTAGSLTVGGGDVLRWVGSVYAEGSQAPTAIQRLHTVVTNYTQIFKDSAKVTGTAASTKFRPVDLWAAAKKEALERHLLKLEHAILRGKKYQDVSSTPKRTFGGLNEFITTTTDFSLTGLSMNDIEDELQDVFQYGAKDKALVCGATQIKILNRIARNNSALQFNLGDKVPKEQTFGLDVGNWATPFGILRIIQHPLMTESTEYTKDGYILDMKYINHVKMEGRDTKWYPNAQLPDEDAKRGYYQTECGLSFALPEVHRRWTGVSAYAADTPPV